MPKIKELFKDKRFFTASLFIAFNAALLYILYFVIKNFDYVAGTAFSWLGSLTSALTPLFLGLLLAYLLNPLVTFIDKKIMSKVFFKMPTDPVKLKRRKNLRYFLSILITFLIIMAVICLIIYAFAVLIVGQFVFSGISNMVDKIIEYFLTYDATIKQWISDLPQGALADKIQIASDSIIAWVGGRFSASGVIGFITGLGGSIVNLALGAIVSIYLMKDKDFFFGIWRKTLHMLLPQKANAIVTETLNDVNKVLSQFIRGALMDALIIAILSSVGLSIIGLDFAVFIGCFAGIANVIPYFGPILGMIPAFLVGAFTEGAFAGGVFNGVLAVGVLLLIQQIDCNIIYPKIVGATTGLHPLFVLLAVSIAGYYCGILGMVLAVPIAGIIQVFVLKWVCWLDKKKSEIPLE